MDGTHKNGNAKDANHLIKYSFCLSLFTHIDTLETENNSMQRMFAIDFYFSIISIPNRK